MALVMLAEVYYGRRVKGSSFIAGMRIANTSVDPGSPERFIECRMNVQF
ncbi:MAG: hypothetical protein Q8M86_04255 [Syntrophales bacterium]|nr:hypothetical protein [Syntrophales bacterium]